MLLVIFYCGLISFVVSARPTNVTSLTDAQVPNNSDTSNADHARKDCVLQIEENDITNIVKHSEDDLVNIVDFHFFNGTNQHDKLFEDMQIALVTLVGREILLILDKEYYNFAASALNAGREKVNVHLKNASSTKCTKEKVAVSILEQIVVRNENPRNYEVCYEKTVIRSRQFAWEGPPTTTIERTNRRMCCRIFKTNVATNFNHECSERDSILKKSQYLIILTILTMVTLTFYVLRILCMLLSHSFFEMLHPRYYKLQESTISLTSIFVKIVWENNDCIWLSIGLSLFRTLVILGASGYNIYLCVAFLSTIFSSATRAIIMICILCTLSLLIAEFCFNLRYNYILLRLETSEIESNLIKFNSFPIPFCNEEKIPFFFKPFTPLYYFLVSTPLALFEAIRLGYEHNIKICESLNSFLGICLPISFLVIHAIVVMVFTIFQFPTYLMLTYALQSLLLGLFLNLTHFLPYLAAIAVFTFYSYGTWKLIEGKYFLLKLIIHEECQAKILDTRHANETLPEITTCCAQRNLR